MKTHSLSISIACLVVALSTCHAVAQPPSVPVPPSWILPDDQPVILDLEAGNILGVVMGMDEGLTRDALVRNHLPDVRRIDYPNYFLLQACLGIVLNFRGGHELNDIYTNSPRVVLSNGLKIGQSIKDFSAKLGQPSATKRLPSKIGRQLTYKVGQFDLCAICLDKTPDTVSALTLRKHEEP